MLGYLYGVNMPTVKELRQTGYKVRVYHLRNALIYQRGKERIGKNLSRFEIMQFASRTSDAGGFAASVLPTGGMTVVEVTKDGKTSRGEAKVFYKDNYCKKTGVKLALEKALNELAVS